MECSVTDCPKPARNRGWCSMHYERWRKSGDTGPAESLATARPTEERFWSRVEKTASCWLWLGATHGPESYGVLHIGTGRQRVRVFAHRFAYQLLVGPIPEDTQLHHRCEEKRCVNPEHLEPLSPAAHLHQHDPNAARTASLAARESCKRGHPKAQHGHYNGRQWTCRECRRLTQIARRASQSA